MSRAARGGNVAQAALGYRVLQLVVGIACMVAIANLQYGWTLFVDPINQQYQWGRPAIQLAFTIFILMETWLVPVEGWLIDQFGLRTMFLIAGVLVGLGWVTNAYASSLPRLYAAAVIGGIGGGIVYGGSVGNALKWFPDHRGLAAGLTAAGYGMGAALTVVPIATMIKTQGYASAFVTFGMAQGLVVIVLALLFRAPRPGEVPTVHSQRVQQTTQDSRPTQMLTTPIFWLLYVMFTMMATGGLMATAQLASVAKDYKIGDVPVTILGLTLAALPFTLSIDRVLNGLTRPFFGWLSDRLGRENTMGIAFSLEGAGILLLLLNAHHPVAFVLLSGVVFFAWGEIYSLFPAICSDLFGRQYATVNYGLLYTAKGTAALLVPISAWIVTMTGSWVGVFLTAASFDLIAAGLALGVLKPWRIRLLGQARTPQTSA
jgi:MFS transporter, OFA family, oxalate/formate antiporter